MPTEKTPKSKTQKLASALRRAYREMNLSIFLPYMVLSIIGLIMVFTASSYRAISEGNDVSYYVVRQLVFMGVGFVVAMLIYRLRVTVFRSQAFKKLAIAVISLALVFVLFFGEEINGAKGWIDLYVISIQPIEFAKPVLILLLADYFSRYQKDFGQNPGWKGFFRVLGRHPLVPGAILLWLGIAVLLPDIGGFGLLLVIASLMVLGSGISSKVVKVLSGLAVAGYAVLVLGARLANHLGWTSDNYQVQRLLSFVNPLPEAQGIGHQLVNSYYALKGGGLFGRGLGNSVQKLGYLPEAHNDFIMAIVGEELGLVGLIFILGLYFYLTLYLYYRAQKARSVYIQMLLIGLASYFLIQAVINLGGVTGLLPITGITFPFISYGGSSILTSAIMVGLALSAVRADQNRV